MKTIALILALCLPLAALFSLARRKDAKSWQHHTLLVALTIYSSILLLGVSDHLASFGYGDAKVEFVNQKVEEAKRILERIEKLQAETDFRSTVIEAVNDSRPALDKLRQIAADPQNPFSDKAKDAVRSITLNFLQGWIMPDGSSYPWPDSIDKQKITIEQIYEELNRSSNLHLQELIAFVQDNAGFTIGQKMNFYLKIIREGQSNHGVDLAGYFFKEEAKLSALPPFSHREYEAWWEKNKDKYK